MQLWPVASEGFRDSKLISLPFSIYLLGCSQLVFREFIIAYDYVYVSQVYYHFNILKGQLEVMLY